MEDVYAYEPGRVYFGIAGDALICVEDPENPPVDYIDQLDDHWYHFWFPCGI